MTISQSLTLFLALAMLSPSVVASGTGARKNASVLRQVQGALEYRKLSDGSVIGSENWTLTNHPDGSRTLEARNQYDIYDVQRHVIHRVTQNFRPLETLAVYWAKGEWRGSGIFMTKGNVMEAVVNTPHGVLRQELSVPEHFSMVPHPISTNAWHAWYYDKVTAGKQTAMFLDIIVANPEAAFMLAQLTKNQIEYIGEQQMTTPAGTFTVDHFRTGTVDYYVTGEDAVMVKFAWEVADVEFVLTEYAEVQQ